MHTKALRHIISKRYTALEEASAAIQKDFDKDAIHTFRVQVKKLRAFLRLLNVKLPRKIKKIYAAAGQIRDIQLQRKEIHRASDKKTKPVDYLALLDEELRKRKAFFDTVTKQNHFRGSRRKLFRKLPANLSLDYIGNYLRRAIDDILALISAGVNGNNDLHTARKKIKDIIYINEIYRDELEQHHRPEILNDRSRKEALAMADELGKFVDKWVSLSLLKPDWLKDISPEERKQLQSIRQRWQTQKQTLRTSISGKLQSASFSRTLKR